MLVPFVPAFLLGAWAAGLAVTVPENGTVLSVLLTVGVSLRTQSAPEKDVGVVFEGLGAD